MIGTDFMQQHEYSVVLQFILFITSPVPVLYLQYLFLCTQVVDYFEQLQYV